jgi:hypothetical protein
VSVGVNDCRRGAPTTSSVPGALSQCFADTYDGRHAEARARWAFNATTASLLVILAALGMANNGGDTCFLRMAAEISP